MPESLGSRRRLLPAGVVCDQCNNYFARKVEQPILNHPSFRNLRAWYQVPNKRGKSPSLYGHIGGTNIQIGLRLSNGKIKVETEKASDACHLESVLDSNLSSPLLFTMQMNPPEREMSRFLCKMALETVAENFCLAPDGMDMIIDSPFFDNIRMYSRYGTNYLNWPYSQRRIFPEKALMRHPKTNKWVHAGFGCGWFMNKRKETLFVFCFYGVEFVINVGGPSIRGYEEWLADHNNISPMVERLGCYLVSKKKGSSISYYLHGEFNPAKGLEFDKAHGYIS
jgi:hypothetical protein